MIYIEPCGGLGNRMRAIDSAIHLARHRGTEVTVFWKVIDELHAPFEMLFEPFARESRVKRIYNMTEPNYLNEYYDKYFTGRLKKFFKPELIDNAEWDNSEPGKAYFKIFYDFMNGQPGYDAAFADYSKRSWDRMWPKRNYYIRSYSRFFEDDMSSYRFFKPVSEVLRKAEAILSKTKGYCCGVHIRRTDQQKAIEISTTDKYVLQMEEEIRQRPDVLFYLATDDASEKEFMQQYFKDRIITADVQLGRNYSEAVKDSLTELYILSKMQKIIGSYESSFTQTAVSYGGCKPYHVIQ